MTRNRILAVVHVVRQDPAPADAGRRRVADRVLATLDWGGTAPGDGRSVTLSVADFLPAAGQPTPVAPSRLAVVGPVGEPSSEAMRAMDRRRRRAWCA